MSGISAEFKAASTWIRAQSFRKPTVDCEQLQVPRFFADPKTVQEFDQAFKTTNLPSKSRREGTPVSTGVAGQISGGQKQDLAHVTCYVFNQRPGRGSINAGRRSSVRHPSTHNTSRDHARRGFASGLQKNNAEWQFAQATDRSVAANNAHRG
jgi:hypothetical protein